MDHTGIDLIARNPHTNELMGISVKSRSRSRGREQSYVNIPNSHFDKVQAACDAFECEPYFAIVVDAADTIRAFLMPMSHLLQVSPMRKTASGWRMTKKALESYYSDPAIKIFELDTKTVNWW